MNLSEMTHVIEIELQQIARTLPVRVAEFLQEADRRIDRLAHGSTSSYRGFVPSDYVAIYHALRAVEEMSLTCGDRFCEWGSGLGVVASLAAMLGYESYGIEAVRPLCEAAESLAEDFNIEVTFIHGSFVPPGSDVLIDQAFAAEGGSLSLETAADDAYEELGLEVADFDLVFVYPWPSDEELTRALFEKHAADGCLLLTYSEPEGPRLYRR